MAISNAAKTQGRHGLSGRRHGSFANKGDATLPLEVFTAIPRGTVWLAEKRGTVWSAGARGTVFLGEDR